MYEAEGYLAANPGHDASARARIGQSTGLVTLPRRSSVVCDRCCLRVRAWHRWSPGVAAIPQAVLRKSSVSPRRRCVAQATWAVACMAPHCRQPAAIDTAILETASWASRGHSAAKGPVRSRHRLARPRSGMLPTSREIPAQPSRPAQARSGSARPRAGRAGAQLTYPQRDGHRRFPRGWRHDIRRDPVPCNVWDRRPWAVLLPAVGLSHEGAEVCNHCLVNIRITYDLLTATKGRHRRRERDTRLRTASWGR